jgi:hypothetical protein
MVSRLVRRFHLRLPRDILLGSNSKKGKQKESAKRPDLFHGVAL